MDATIILSQDGVTVLECDGNALNESIAKEMWRIAMQFQIHVLSEDLLHPPRASVYVAGKFAHHERIGEYVRELRDLGHSITWDWTTPEARALGPMQASAHGVAGVQQCDVLVLVLDCPDHAYRGSFCELGAALSRRTPVIVCNLAPNTDRDASVFLKHPLCVRCDSWDAVKGLLLRREFAYVAHLQTMYVGYI